VQVGGITVAGSEVGYDGNGRTLQKSSVRLLGVSGGQRFARYNYDDRGRLTTSLYGSSDPNADPAKQAEASKKLDQLRPGKQIQQEAERSKENLNDPLADLKMLFGYLKAPLILVLLLLLAIAWAIFYYPMALAVAGYTQSIGSVINPLVGLDTIKRMRGTYFKAFGLVLLVQLVGGLAGIIVSIILSPFALPWVGNLPAMFIDGSLTFYFNLVIACVLGLSLFKCADRLGIEL